MAKELLQYNIEYDRHETDREFILTQLQTHLRERFNVLISTIEYEIVDGHLVRPGKTEPFINSIRRGRDIIQALSPDAVDVERENAEVTSFEEKIDPFLSIPQTPLGSKVLLISLNGGEGSKYQHNFYDIFTLKRRNSKRYVEMSRYSSALETQDYAARIPGLDPENPPSAVEFLANPIFITDIFVSAEQIHQMLHESHEYMTSEDFSQIWDEVRRQPFIGSYLRRRDARSFNAILNFADEVWENMKMRKAGQAYRDFNKRPLTLGEIRGLQEKEVRQVNAPCPGKSGADTDSAFSVSDFDNFGYEFDQPGPCKKCGEDVNCGPCGICRNCDLQIRKEQTLKSVKIL